jgi:hypothetical protein
MQGPGDVPVTLTLAVDIRRHLAGATRFYFGNAFLIAAITSTPRALASASIVDIAMQIREAVDRLPERVAGCLGAIEAVRRAHGLDALSRFRSVVAERGLGVSNLARIPLAALDFGAGPPRLELARPALRERGCVILPGADGPRLVVAR